MINLYGLSVRFLLFLVTTALIVVLVTAEFFYQSTYEREIEASNQDIDELYQAVAATASISAFLEDLDLAKEPINGLTKSDKILAASIKGNVIYYQVNVAKAIENKVEARVYKVRHPFIPEENLAEIKIYPNFEHIITQAEEISLDNNTSLYIEAFVVLVIALVINYYIIIFPMIRVSRSLNEIKPGTTDRVDMPDFHNRSEIGALVKGSNLLLGKVEQQLTQERQLRSEIEFLEQRFRMLFENAKSATVLMTDNGYIQLRNNAFNDLITKIGLDDKQEYGELLEDIFEDSRSVKSSVFEAFSRNEFATGEFKLKSTMTDKIIWVQLIASPILTDDGEKYYQLTLNDISNRKQELQRLALQADFDSLTGIYNRNGGEKLIAKLIAKGHHFALVLMDLNGFKGVNDVFGHDAGDEVLIFVAEQLKQNLRKNDVAIRWGGDEFVVLVQAEDKRSVTAVMEKVNACIKQPFYFNDDESETTVSMSAGVTFYPHTTTSIDSLIKKADIAMYKAKENKLSAPERYLIFAD